MADRVPLAVTVVAVRRRFATPSGHVDALVDIDADVAPGSLTVIAGPSGSGKSTLLRLIACLDRPTSGTVSLDGVDVAARSTRQRRALRRRLIGIVAPEPAKNLLTDRTARQNVEWSARLRGAPADALEQLGAVGLAARAGAASWSLSTGEQQRAALVCAFAGTPGLVVADEPTASLDAANGAAIATLLATMAGGRGGLGPATVVVASHDPAVIELADDVITLDHGRRT